MATKKGTEYGFLIGTVSTGNTENTITKASFLATLESQYPSAQGWEVYDTQVTPLSGLTFTVAYHVRKVNE